MDKDNDNGAYREKLDPEAKQRYLDKLTAINNIDPLELAAAEWTTDPAALPPLHYLDLVHYLVEVGAHTMAEFKNYKSFPDYQQFSSGAIRKLQIHKPANSDRTVVLAMVWHSLSDGPLQVWEVQKAWAIMGSSGEVSSAHCTCMTGDAKTCTHVGALLFKVELAVQDRESDMPVTDEDLLYACEAYKIDFTTDAATRKSRDSRPDGETDHRPGLRTCAASKVTIPPPTQAEMDAFYAELHKANPRAVCLSVLPGYCEAFRDPVEPNLCNESSLQQKDGKKKRGRKPWKKQKTNDTTPACPPDHDYLL